MHEQESYRGRLSSLYDMMATPDDQTHTPDPNELDALQFIHDSQRPYSNYLLTRLRQFLMHLEMERLMNS